MAGIGFALERLRARGDLSAAAQAYGAGAIIAAGPWIMTVAAIALITLAAETGAGRENLRAFRTLIIYNFAGSLVFSAPFAMAATRVLADMIHAKDVSHGAAIFATATAASLAVQLPLAALLYFGFADMPAGLAVLALVSYALTAALWMATPYLSALKDYGTVVLAFFVGLAVAVGGAVTLGVYGPGGLLTGFTMGIGLTAAILSARIFAEYPGTWAPLAKCLSQIWAWRSVGLAGLLYMAGLWSDKWIMWLAPEADWSQYGLPTHPAYDGAMFIAHLSLIPALAVFAVAFETRFFRGYKRYYDAIARHGTLAQIEARREALADVLRREGARTAAMQAGILIVGLLAAASIGEILAMHARQIAMFRLGLLGTAFHVALLIALIVLGYFDMRRESIAVGALFLVLNAGLTALTLWLGPPSYGFGYAAAAIISAAVAVLLCAQRTRELTYQTFVAHNPALGR